MDAALITDGPFLNHRLGRTLLRTHIPRAFEMRRGFVNSLMLEQQQPLRRHSNVHIERCLIWLRPTALLQIYYRPAFGGLQDEVLARLAESILS
jgi:hypothetical protein